MKTSGLLILTESINLDYLLLFVFFDIVCQRQKKPNQNQINMGTGFWSWVKVTENHRQNRMPVIHFCIKYPFHHLRRSHVSLP